MCSLVSHATLPDVESMTVYGRKSSFLVTSHLTHDEQFAYQTEFKLWELWELRAFKMRNVQNLSPRGQT